MGKGGARAKGADSSRDPLIERGRGGRLFMAGLDPRRFGAMLWTDADPLAHPRLRSLGPEPLSDTFTGNHLLAHARGKRVAIPLNTTLEPRGTLRLILRDGRVEVHYTIEAKQRTDCGAEIIAGHGCEDHVLQAEPFGGLGNPVRFVRLDLFRPAFGH